MGYGGVLIWSGLARNLKKSFPDKKIVFIYKSSWKSFLLNKPYKDHVIFKNNPDVEKVLSKQAYFFRRIKKPNDWLVVDMENKALHYWESENKDKIVFKNNGKHAIQIACDYYGLEKADLRPKIIFTKEEIEKTKNILKKEGLLENKFVAVEPNAKEDFSHNKKWDLQNWQKVSDFLRQENIKVAQVGVKGSEILKNVIDLTGKTSFREAVCVLSKAKVFAGIEGGLAHGAAGVGTKAVILISGFVPKDLFAYPGNINFYGGDSCESSSCGIKKPCSEAGKCMAKITPKEVAVAVFEEYIK